MNIVILTEDNKDEAQVIEPSQCLHEPGSKPVLDFLCTFQMESSPMVNNHFTGEMTTQENNDRSILSKCSRNTFTNSFSETINGGLDPLTQVIPTSSEITASISEYTDFIRYLPVHLSKMILSMLDTVSLYNALCVSLHWGRLAEEVRLEHIVNQQIKEQVMLMQVSELNLFFFLDLIRWEHLMLMCNFIIPCYI